MKKTGKRFVALAIIFASIMSFLPIEFGSNGQAANAITTAIQVNASNEAVTITNGEYVTQEPNQTFTLSVESKKVYDNVNDIPMGQTAVTAQDIIIKSIDGIQLDVAQTEADRERVLEDNNTKLADTIGSSISYGNIEFNNWSPKRIGLTITGLPYGVNVIEYQIKETTVTSKAVTTTDSTGKTTTVGVPQAPKDTYYPSQQTNEKLIIQHANKFVQKKIDPMTFDSYIGDINAYNEKSTDNTVPFLFSQVGEYDEACPLRYNFNVSDAVSTLEYIMKFDPTVPIDNNTIVYKNGNKDDTITINDKTISGYLKDLGLSDLIVVKLSNNGTNVSKSYAIQLKYNTINASQDYTLRNAGIKKLYYDADDSVQAYIGKNFDVTTENGTTVYKGNIYLDRRAQMISMVPELGAKSNIAYKLYNRYDNSNTESSRIVNGQSNPYVDFNKGTKNQIVVEVYEGAAGNIKEGSSPLAKYILDVNFIGDSQTSAVNFVVGDDNGDGIADGYAYLTQPGRTSQEDKIEFQPSRRTYNLNFVDNTNDNVSINLTSPKTFTNTLERREYLKVWAGTSTQSDNVTELTDLGKYPEVNVNISNYKKIIVQAYYDQITYNKQDPTKIDSTTPYPLGEKYTFYIAKNPDTTEPTVTKSTDASLTNIKVSNGALKATDGTSGFSTDKTSYTATVPKIDKSSAVTVTASSSKVKDITATIAETGDEYGLVSGEPFDFPLNATGATNIKIVVTAEDAATTKTYNLTINNDSRSASALLKNVITDNGDFTFDAEKDINKIRVDQAINKLKVSPVPVEANSRVTVNGTKFTGSPIIIDLKGSQKTDMTITVTSEDGSTSKTYDFEIYRTDAPIDDNKDDNMGDTFYDEIDDCWVDLSKYEEWGTIGGKDIYFDKKGRQVKNRWITTKGVQYYLDSKGYKSKGWRKEVGGKTYYLDPNTGALKTGWLNQNNKWYYLGLNGVMQKGWLELNGHWYYFTPEGEMIANQSMYIEDGVYRFGSDGIMY